MSHLAADGLPDDRVTCAHCRHFGGRFHCNAFETSTLPDLPRRCIKFVPLASLSDQRTGKARWPDLAKQIEELRALEATTRAAR